MINETAVEQQAIAWFQEVGWAYLHGSKLAPDVAPEQRVDGKAVVLAGRIKDAALVISDGITARVGSLTATDCCRSC